MMRARSALFCLMVATLAMLSLPWPAEAARRTKPVTVHTYRGQAIQGTRLAKGSDTSFRRCYESSRQLPRGFSSSFICSNRQKACEANCRGEGTCAGYTFERSSRTARRNTTMTHGKCTFYQRGRPTKIVRPPYTQKKHHQGYAIYIDWTSALMVQAGDPKPPPPPRVAGGTTPRPKADARRAQRLSIRNAGLSGRALATKTVKSDTECHAACIANSRCTAYSLRVAGSRWSCGLYGGAQITNVSSGSAVLLVPAGKPNLGSLSMRYAPSKTMFARQTTYVASDRRLYPGGSKNIVWDPRKELRGTSVTNLTLTTCRLHCAVNSACVGIQYAAKSKTCQLFQNGEPSVGSGKAWGEIFAERRGAVITRALTGRAVNLKRPAPPKAPTATTSRTAYKLHSYTRWASSYRKRAESAGESIECMLKDVTGRTVGQPRYAYRVRFLKGGKKQPWWQPASASFSSKVPLSVSCKARSTRGVRNLTVRTPTITESQVKRLRNPSIFLECSGSSCTVRVGERQSG